MARDDITYGGGCGRYLGFDLYCSHGHLCRVCREQEILRTGVIPNKKKVKPDLMSHLSKWS